MEENKFDKELLKLAVETANKSGADEVIAKLIEKKKHQIRFSSSSIDVNKEWQNYSLDVFVSKRPLLSFTGKMDTVTIQDPDKEKIKKIIPKKVKVLDSLPKSKLYWGVDEETYNSNPSIDLYDDKMENFQEKGPELVKKMIQSAEEGGAKKTAGVLYSETKKTGILTHSGNGGDYKSSFCRATIRSFYDEESSGQGVIATRNLSNFRERSQKIGKKSGKLSKRGAGSEVGKPGTYDLIMSPVVGANIFGNLLNGANPITILSGMSCLKGKKNEKIGPEELNIKDDPLIKEGLNSRPFDDEGTPSEKTDIIKDGELKNLIHNTSTAKLWSFINKIKLKFWITADSTSNSVLGQMGMTNTEENPKMLMPRASNYRFSPGDYTLQEIISTSSKPTIYLTSNWYTRFTNMSEGEFSTVPRDAMFLIEDGEIKKPIKGLRLKENLVDMCENIEAIGKDVKQVRWWEVNTPTFIPTIKVKNCKFTKAKEKKE